MIYRTAPIGLVFEVANGATPKSGNSDYWDGDVPWVTPADLGKISSPKISKGARNISQEGLASCGTQIVPSGTIILSTRAPIGHTAIADARLCFNQGCRGLIPSKDIRSKFAYWAILSCKLQLQSAGQGTTFLELGRGKLRATKIPLPDLATQRRIADFLDRETARLDLLVEKKQRLVAFLGERLVSLKTKYCMQGIGNEPMTETGIDWWPNAPSLWEILRIATLFDESKEMGEDGLPVLSVSINWGISDKELADEDRGRVVNLIEDRASYKRVRVGDLVYNMMRAWQGGFGVAKVDGLVSPAYVVARPKKGIHSTYFEHLLRTPTCIEEFRRASKGIADFRQRLYWEHFRQLRLVIPPLDQQKFIAKKIDMEQQKFEPIVKATSNSITRLKEYRSALITAAVTGQINVATYARTGGTDSRLDTIEQEAGA